jgi:hypothetical protein
MVGWARENRTMEFDSLCRGLTMSWFQLRIANAGKFGFPSVDFVFFQPLLPLGL